MQENVLLEMENVALGYTDESVLSNINLHIQRGQVAVIAGVSGCGKSTLLKGAIGLLPPSKGSIRLLGTNLVGLDEERLNELRSHVGLLFQEGALLNSMTVAENVTLPLFQHTRLSASVMHKLARMKLAQVGLEGVLHKIPAELSGGMRKRVALARAMVLDPELLFCDEPSAGLDPITAHSLDRLLLNLRSAMKITLLVVTHELRSIEAIADRVIMIAQGGIAFDGTWKQTQECPLRVVRDFFDHK